LIVISLILVFGKRPDEGTHQSTILEQSAVGMVLELPVVTTDFPASWQTEWVPTSEAARQQVLQSLNEFYTDFRQLRPQLGVWVEPGSEPRNQLAERFGSALAQHSLGAVMNDAQPPPVIDKLDSGVLLYCRESDSVLARRMLAALAPYLAGRVTLRYDPEATAQSMRAYFFGQPYFNGQGQVTFDQVVVAQGS
jgi:hypothetical protein